MTMISKELPADLSKVLGEWALTAGRCLQSKQTGYIHYYQGEAQPGAQTIPLVENVLFAFALLRSRLVEQIQEAKVILKNLLAFQNLQNDSSYGNFPVYLHEYPRCQDTMTGLQLLSPFNWILKQFGHVLGAELKQQIEQAAHLALEHSLRAHQLKPLSYSFAVRLAAAQLSYGILWEKEEWKQEGSQQLEELAKQQLDGWNTTKQLGDLLIGLQMVYSSIKNSPWKSLWQYMEQTWHHPTGCYVGPCVREWQERQEPKTNLYDLYAGYFAGQFSKRATLLQLDHLQGILIQASSEKFVLPSTFFTKSYLKQQRWQVVGDLERVYTVLEKKELYHSSIDKMYTPFRMVWGDLHHVHSLVCQGGSYEKVEYILYEQSVELMFDLRDNLNSEDHVQQRVIEFFVDFHPDFLFTLKGQSTNTFELGQTIELAWGPHQVSLVFEILAGEGTFLGHVMRGNRSSQIGHKEEKRFQSYDWSFFLRTIRRQSPCRLKATLSFRILD